MSTEKYNRTVLLNHMVSRSSTHAGQEYIPPVHSAEELLEIIEARRKQGVAIEYLNATDKEVEEQQKSNTIKFDFVRLRDTKIIMEAEYKYVVLLIEFADRMDKTLPVIHAKSFVGRELTGEDEEFGSSTAHVVVRVPSAGNYDDGSYRCAIEYAQGGVSRKNIGIFLRRQLRKHARDLAWSFEVTRPAKKGKVETKSYRYTPKLDLLADVGRSLGDGTASSKVLTSMVFTKRMERRSTARKTSVKNVDYEADVAIKVSISSGPKDPAERLNWVQRIRDEYNDSGYTSHLYFRSVSGSAVGGRVHDDVEGAADLLLCPKEVISVSTRPRRWRAEVCDELAGKLREILDTDDLWTRVG